MSNDLPRGDQQSSPVGREEKGSQPQTNGENESHGLQPELRDWIKYNNKSDPITPDPTHSLYELQDLADPSTSKYTTHRETSFNYIKPMTRDRNTVYSLRYTHETPLGKLEDKRGHVDDFFANDASDLQRRKPKLKQGMEALKEKKKQWARTSCGRRTKVTVTCVLVVVAIATIMVVLYFKVISEQGEPFQQ